MNSTNARRLILSNGIAVSVALFIWMVTSGLDVTTVYGATRSIPYTFDKGAFNITDLSIQDGDYSTNIIGFIENTDPFLNTIEGVSLQIEMYDRNNHLIDVTESGYSSTLPDTFAPHEKSAFKIPIEKNNELDHLNIRILATDWGNVSPFAKYSSNPYMGIVGLSLTPDLSKQIGLNQTKGFLLTSITKGSPGDKSGLRGGSTTITYNGRDIDIGGDIILKIDNQSVSKIDDILEYVSQKHVGDKVHLTILRDNAIREVDVILGERPSQIDTSLDNFSNTFSPQNGDNNYLKEQYDYCINNAGYGAGKGLCDLYNTTSEMTNATNVMTNITENK